MIFPRHEKLASREIAFLSLPVLIIGGVAFWRTRVPVPVEPKELPPADATVGPLRLEFGPWESVSPSPGEVATGHLLKKIGRVYLAGQNAKQWRQRSFYLLNANTLALEFRRGEQWHKVARPGGWNGIREVRLESGDIDTQSVQNQKFSLSMPFALVPHDAEEVRLRGQFKLHLENYMGNGRFREHDVASPQINLSLWHKGQPRPGLTADQTSHLSLKHLETQFMGEAAKEPTVDDAPYFATAQLTTRLDAHWKPPLWNRKQAPPLILPQDVQLLDKLGYDWAKSQPHKYFADENLGHTNLGRNPFIRARFSDANSVSPYLIKVSTRFIPRSAGEIRLKLRLSRHDNQSGADDWPLTLEGVVRPQWMTEAPRDLVLESVNLVKRKTVADWVSKNGQYVDVVKNTPCVEVVLNYKGQRPLVLRGAVDQAPMFAPSQVAEDRIIAKIPFGDRQYSFFGNARLTHANASEEELISSWSQRIEDAQGRLSKLYYDNVSASSNMPLAIDTSKPLLERRGNKTRVTVRYFLHGQEKVNHKSPLIFKAEIGLRNRGFLEIEQKLP